MKQVKVALIAADPALATDLTKEFEKLGISVFGFEDYGIYSKSGLTVNSDAIIIEPDTSIDSVPNFLQKIKTENQNIPVFVVLDENPGIDIVNNSFKLPVRR